MKIRMWHLTILATLLFGLGFVLKAVLPQVSTGTWSSTPASMSAARSGASAALLEDGRILITGGDSGSGPVAAAEFFGTDGNFAAAPAMNNARSGHVSATLSDGRVLVAGGATGGGATNAAEIFDPNANSWTEVAGGMTEARAGATATLLQDGRVLLAGGSNGGAVSQSAEMFDPNANSFSFAGTLSSPRMQHAAALLADGRVLVIGGTDGTNILASSDIYDPVAGTIAQGPALTTPRQNFSATTLLDGRVIAIGGAGSDGQNGTTELASAEMYDPLAGGGFTAAANSLATARQGHLAFLLPHNNSVLIVGGTASGAALSSVELYIPWQNSGTFASTGAMATARESAAGSALGTTSPQSQNDGFLLVAGGSDGTNSLSSAELYGFNTVKTDQPDYAPGTTVNITGTGWQPGETVTLSFQEQPAFDVPPTLTAVADASGNIANSQFVPDQYDIGVTFYLTAVGQTSGWQAQATFTDAIKVTVTRSSPSGATLTELTGSNFTVTFSVANGNTAGNSGTNLNVSWTLTLTGGITTLDSTSGTITGLTGSTPSLLTFHLTAPSSAGSGTVTLGATITSPTCTPGPPNVCTDSAAYSVTINAAPDLTATKTDSVSHSGTVGVPWTWSVAVANTGSAAATFTTNQVILHDDLPSTNMSYGSVSVGSTSGISGAGTINCGIDVSNVLTCTASGGSVVIAATTGTFTVSFSATASTTGTFGNPRAAGTCAVDPDTHITESNESNNSCSDSVTVAGQPDLTATKTNDVSGTTTLPTGWTWSIAVANTGGSGAAFADTQVILKDDLPSSGLTYGSVTVDAFTNVTNSGSISCGIDLSKTLTCTASGATVTIGATTGTFTVQIPVTPTAAGTYDNPRASGTCKADPDSHVTESDETNNTCSNTVIVKAPDLTATKSNDAASSTVLLGGHWNWSIEVANGGNADAMFTTGQVILHDDLPNSNITYGSISGVPANVSCAINVSDTLTCSATASYALAASSNFTISFQATPSAVGSFANPRGSGGTCKVDPDNHVTESDETNNSCSDTVTVKAPDLTAMKSNDVSGTVVLGNTWHWKITVANSPASFGADAVFSSGQVILSDDLPSSNITYGSVSVVSVTDVTNSGNISCGIDVSNVLTCTASGASVTIKNGTGTFAAQFEATPSAIGTFTNPRGGGSCSVDPNNVITESNESNNACGPDSVEVTAIPTSTTVSVTAAANSSPIYSAECTGVTAPNACQQWSDQVTLKADVTPCSSSFGGVNGTVEFKIGTVSVASGVAISSPSSSPACEASTTVALTQATLPAGTYTVTAIFTSGNTNYLGSTSTNDPSLKIVKERAIVTPSVLNPSEVQVTSPGSNSSEPFVLAAAIQEESDGSPGDITLSEPITITLTGTISPSNTAFCSTTGTVNLFTTPPTLNISCTFSALPVDVYTIVFSVTGNYYTGSADSIVTVFDPSLGFTTGGGTVVNPNTGCPANFGFNVKFLKNGNTQGGMVFVEHQSAACGLPLVDLILKSNSMGSLAIVGNTASFPGKATLNGVGGYTFIGTAVDNGTPGIYKDQFGLQVAYSSVGVAALTFPPQYLTGGNIQVPQPSGKK